MPRNVQYDNQIIFISLNGFYSNEIAIYSNLYTKKYILTLIALQKYLVVVIR